MKKTKSIIRENYEFFKKELPAILPKYENQFALIVEKKLLNTLTHLKKH